MKIALAQINPTIGDFDGNVNKILAMAAQAGREGADLAVFPELAVMGYPPRDLVEVESFVEHGLRALDAVRKRAALPVLTGFVARNRTGSGKRVRNAAALIADGEIRSEHAKTLLPTYDVFDEDRYFEPAAARRVAEFGGQRLGITICEDVWRNVPDLRFRYPSDPVAELASQGATVLLNLSASPYSIGKEDARRKLLSDLAARHGLPVVYVNQVGGNDELIFDGGSMVLNAQGEVVARAKQFEEALLIVDLDDLPEPTPPPETEELATVFSALTLGTRDYLHKCGFEGAVIGLSGGIDSAMTAVVAAHALGPQNVLGVAMPSRFSSEHSLQDAEKLARALGIRFEVIPIEPAHKAFLDMLAPAFEGRAPDVAEENIQARCRGIVTMALANKFHMLALTTGNKSELATGYCTLYGDMAGGLAPLGDVPKSMVYRLARWINRGEEVIPAGTIEKPPSAELKPNQLDQDTLPPYDQLDKVLHQYVEEQQSVEAIVKSGVERDVVLDVVRRIEAAEFKRRQAVPGLKITSKAFGSGRRVPVAKRMPQWE